MEAEVARVVWGNEDVRHPIGDRFSQDELQQAGGLLAPRAHWLVDPC